MPSLQTQQALAILNASKGQIMKISLSRFLAGSVAILNLASAQAEEGIGTFSTLTYNIAGLPEIISSAESERQAATEQISCYINTFGIVNVQEDFNYHAALYDTCNTHVYRSSTSGGAGIGSGLNTLSDFSYEDWTRVQWDNCNGVDCLTPKGFTLARVTLEDGAYVDIYNLHTQAQTEDADLTTRRANLLQLAEYIETHSAGNAVIVMGDTNTRYTRSGDNIRELLYRGFTDAWIQLIRDGSVPALGATALTCNPKVTDADCEIVDKILYRDNGHLNLSAYLYDVREDAKTNDGLTLSDHPPVEARWTYETDDEWQFSDRIGGPHGTGFNDLALLPEKPAVRQVVLRTGSRVDQIALTLDNGYRMTHGGTGGKKDTLTLGANEYLKTATFCSAKHNSHTRIFYASLTSNKNNTISGGSKTDNCATYKAESGWSIVGFHGRSGDEVDKVGVIYAPVQTSMSAASYTPLTNIASGLCLDINGAEMADGTNVALWYCSGNAWQAWNYDERTGLIRSRHNPKYCLDNSGSFNNGANMIISTCTGNVNQQFTMHSDGRFSMRTLTSQVIDANGVSAGDNVTTWHYWGGNNQLWN
jgi:hypothetical protein